MKEMESTMYGASVQAQRARFVARLRAVTAWVRHSAVGGGVFQDCTKGFILSSQTVVQADLTFV